MGIKEIRILKQLRPDEYRELAEEYLSTRLQDFCMKHSVGKTAAVREFGRKTKYEEEAVSELARKKAEESRMPKPRPVIEGSDDPYYSGKTEGVEIRKYYA